MIDWVKSSGIGDVASIFGVVISLVGFWITFVGVRRSRKAAEEARDKIRAFESIIDFSAAITTLEEIKRLQRQGDAWAVLLDRYASIRKMLVRSRSSGVRMTDAQRTVIQNALAHIVKIEEQVERAMADPTQLKPSKLNSIISEDIDGLVAVLEELKIASSGDVS